MVLLTIIFSTLFGKSIDNYPIYFLSGKCILDFFNAGTGISLTALKGNKNILQKTAVKKKIFVLGGIASETINFLITLIILIAVMIFTKAPFYLLMPLSIIPIISLIFMITGLGLILSILCVYYTDIQHLWSVVTLMLMYACAIFYPIEIIPEPFHHYMILNPLFWIVNQFRCFFIWGITPDLLNIINSLLISTIILIIGIIFFKKYESKVTMKL